MMTGQCDRYSRPVPVEHIGLRPTIPWGRSIQV